ncbi:MAG TPA: sigma factor-like helix-turn-helix DNA-binding protein, partial [Planctomycetaceae bacterium]
EARRRRRETRAARFVGDRLDDTAALEIADALGRLDDATREVVVAHLWGGLTFAEIAELNGTSSSAAHRRYRAGLETLRKTLDEPCPSRTT